MNGIESAEALLAGCQFFARNCEIALERAIVIVVSEE
jgi:hypothetical protein